MIKLDGTTSRLLTMLNALDPDGPEMSKVSEPVKNILKELAKLNAEESKLPAGSLTDEQWAIVRKTNDLSRHIGFDLVVEPFKSDIVPEHLHNQNLLLLREFPSGVVLNWVEILPDKMDTILTVIFWVIQSLFNFYKSKYESMQNVEVKPDGT